MPSPFCLRDYLHETLRVVSCLVLLSSANTALAEGDVENPRYQTALSQAQTHSDQGKYKEAAEALRRAFSISPKPELLFDIAQNYERAGEKRLALRYYQRFVDQAPGDDRITQAIALTRNLQFQLKDQYEEVMITSQPSGAYLYVNDRANGSIGQTPHRIKLLPGTYKIIAELDGYVPAEQQLKLEEGASSQVLINLYSESEVAPVKFLINRPGAQVYVDRRLRGKSPLFKSILIREGVREIRVTKPGFTPWVKQVKVSPQKPMTLDVILTEIGSETLTVKADDDGGLTHWIVMGAGVALMGGGVYTGLSAQSLYSDLEDRRDQRQLIASQDISAGNRFVLMTNILLGLGATSIATGGVLWMLAPPSSPSSPGPGRVAEQSPPATVDLDSSTITYTSSSSFLEELQP